METASDALGVTLPASGGPAGPAVNWTSGLTPLPLSAPTGMEMAHGDEAGDLQPAAETTTDPGDESFWVEMPSGYPQSALDQSDTGEPDTGEPGTGEPGAHRAYWEPQRQKRRPRWPAAAAAAALIAVGGGAWTLAHGATSAHDHAGTMSTAVRPMAMPAQAAPSATATAMPTTAAHSPLMTAIIQANAVTGKVPPSRCAQQGTTRVTCTSPAPGITEAAFQTYPSLSALYAAYEQAFKSVDGGRALQNVQDCGLAAPPPTGAEVSWNHEFVHPRNYTIAQLAAGLVTEAQAAGRVFCITNANTGEATFVWTQDVGHVLAWVTGPLHEQVWDWWATVHHEISIGAPPMRMPSISGA
jgi:hypothetical protein